MLINITFRRVLSDLTKRTLANNGLKFRPPVVTIMGHVDHGKTSLLDAIRHTNVVDSEFGGITQHIGAFSVSLPDKRVITFLDTPGHAAFRAMRARGANCTDIVVLVVAADDGVMPQTVESINFARDAGVPIVVAVNKIDKSNADIDNVNRGLLAQNLVPEDMGGDIQVVQVSAAKRKNLNALAEAILTQAEVLELQADPTANPQGVVIEARTDTSRGGRLCTALVNQGTLKRGTYLIAGSSYCKVRDLRNERGDRLTQVLPGYPAEIVGWRGGELPDAGDVFEAVDGEKRARQLLDERRAARLAQLAAQAQPEIERRRREHDAEHRKRINRRMEQGRKYYTFHEKREGPKHQIIIEAHPDDFPVVKLLIKADVAGSAEALLDLIGTYPTSAEQLCAVDVVDFGVGAVTDKDIELARTFGAIIYAFNVPASASKPEDVDIRPFNIIYRLFNDLVAEINARIPPTQTPTVVGEAVIRTLFVVTDRNKTKLNVAGCNCLTGRLVKRLPFRVRRGDQIVHDGALASMKHHKEEVMTIRKGFDCGLRFEDNGASLEEGDTIECYEMTPVPRTISWQPPGFDR